MAHQAKWGEELQQQVRQLEEQVELLAEEYREICETLSGG